MTDEKSVYRFDTKVFSYDSDMCHRMKMSSLLRAAQTIAGYHLDDNGMAFDTLVKNRSIFVMTKVSVNVFRMPRREENIVLKTWSRSLEGIVFIRDTSVAAEDSEPLAEISANWVLVDPEKHSILRPESLDYQIEYRPDLAFTGTRNGRFRTPKDMLEVGAKRIDYTDCDFIGHMNNTNYADIVTNFAGENIGKEFAELDISFSQEAKIGEEIAVYRKEDDGVVYFRGEHGRGKCFEARAVFKN